MSRRQKGPGFDRKDAFLALSRRSFVAKMSFALAAAGVGQSTRLSLVEDLAKKILPHAHADNVGLPQRLIYIGVRSGVPVIPFGAPKLFADLNNPITPNVPFRGNQFTQGQNGFHFSPDVQELIRHQDNMLITQGVRTDGGHVRLFNFWQGGTGQGQTSPIITLASRNPSSSVIPGVHFTQNANGRRVVEHRNNNLPDLLSTHSNTFRDNFRKATLAFDEKALEKVFDASVRLSRRQALRMQASMSNSLNYTIEQSKAAELLGFDFSEALDPSDMGQVLNSGVNGTYRNFGQALGHTLKAMSYNLINSATIELSVGDWHGLRDMTSTRPYYQDVSAKLAAAVDYLKSTPDLAGPNGTTLWDTTTIFIGSEFNRNDSTFGRDNGDGGSQGGLFLSKKVKGGYFGDAEYLGNSGNGGNPRILRHTGVDRQTGQKLPSGQTNTTQQLYHTINHMIGNPATASEVITGFMR